MDDDARRAAESAVPPWDEQVDRVGDVVTQLEQRERALVRDVRFLRPDRHPSLADVVMLGAREALNAIEPTPHPLESFLLDVISSCRLTPCSRACAGEIAVLLVGVGFQTSMSGLVVVMRKSNIALPLR